MESRPFGGPDKRKFKRRFIQFLVRYRFNAGGGTASREGGAGGGTASREGGAEGVLDDWKQSEAGNVSAGGLFMVFGEDLRVGRALDVEFRVPGREKPVRARGTIVWSKVVVPETMVECGFEFSDISPEDKEFLLNFADTPAAG